MPKQEVKEKSKKARRSKYDLAAQKSIPELQRQDEAERPVTRLASGDADAGSSRPSSIGDLRAKLHAKIEELRQTRGGSSGGKRARSPEAAGVDRRPAKRARHQDGSAAKGGLAAQPSVEESLQFGEISAKPRGKQALDESLRKRSKGKKKSDLQSLLQRAKENKEKLQQLQGTKEGDELKQQHDWDAAMRRAQGEKVRDDPKLLKKSLKRRQRAKKKSAQAWAEREKAVEEQRKGRQDKREQNLQQRATQKKEKRLKQKGVAVPKAKAKSEARPGFEGKRRSFLNAKKK